MEVEATMDGKVCKLSIASECAAIRKMAEELTEVNPYEEISFRRAMPKIHEAGHKYCSHAAFMVLIPAGEFIMGRSDADQENEKPAHKVFLNDFYIDKFEVTNEAYATCEMEGVCSPPVNLSSVKDKSIIQA